MAARARWRKRLLPLSGRCRSWLGWSRRSRPKSDWPLGMRVAAACRSLPVLGGPEMHSDGYLMNVNVCAHLKWWEFHSLNYTIGGSSDLGGKIFQDTRIFWVQLPKIQLLQSKSEKSSTPLELLCTNRHEDCWQTI